MQNPTTRETTRPWRNGSSEFASQTYMKTILYLEDDEHDIFFLERALANQGTDLSIRNVHSLSEATAYLEGDGQYADRKRFPLPCLILSDLSIPGGSGFQLARWLREDPRFRELPIILLSGSAREQQLEKAEISGANCCLEKSSDFSELLARINDLLHAHKEMDH